jgi:hypothetical protein
MKQWKIGDKGMGVISGNLYQILSLHDDIATGKVLAVGEMSAMEIGETVPINLRSLKPVIKKCHPLTEFFKK